MMEKSCCNKVFKNWFFLIVILCLCPCYIWGQNIVVEEFKLQENGVLINPIQDSNGDDCAIIKVETTEKGFSFEASAYGVTKVDDSRDNEIWVYVSGGENTLTIKHPELGVLRDYKLKPAVKKGKVYLLKISTGSSYTIIDHNVTKQYISFNVSPTNATVIVEDEPWSVDEFGHAERLCNFGEYSYRIEAPQYHSTAGKIKLNNSKDRYDVNISLKPAFGWLAVDDNETTRGAELYIDNVRIGKLPMIEKPIVESGLHKVKITKKLYKMYEKDINVVDSVTFNLVAHLEANFATTQLIAGEGVEIWIDDEYKGKGTWNGPLVSGEYKVTCKKENHLDVSQIIKISKGNTEPIQLKSPIPVYGALSVSSDPSGAKVYIDGEDMGSTPIIISKVLIGNHTVTVSKENFKTEDQRIVVRKDSLEHVVFQLKDFARFTINTDPQNASVYIDDSYCGISPHSFESASGSHRIKIQKYKYQTLEKNVEFKSSSPELNFKLKRQYQFPSVFYLQATGDLNSGAFIYGGTLGCYIKNINIEGYYMLPSGEGERVYWSQGEYRPEWATYKTTLITGGRAGYGIILGRRARLTPQLGGHLVNYEKKDGNMYEHSFHCVSASIGARFEYVIASGFGMSATPEFRIPLVKSDDYNAVSSVDKYVKNMSEGIHLNFGLYCYF